VLDDSTLKERQDMATVKEPTQKDSGGLTLTMAQKVTLLVLGALLTAMIGLLLDTRAQVNEARTENREMRLEIKHLREVITTQMDDRFRGSDFNQQIAIRDERIITLRRDVDRLSREMREHKALNGHAVMDRRVKALEDRVRHLEDEEEGG
jgi:regulator of replication initiation timing